jgi:Ca-activated chloride channel family protein
MLQFAWPWVAVFAVLPVLVASTLPRAADIGTVAVNIPFFQQLQTMQSRRTLYLSRRLLWALPVWMLLICAACRPQWLSEPVTMPVSGRDLLLALDSSASMEQNDMVQGRTLRSRFDVVKQIAGEFIGRRAGDRVGLILFGSRAHLHVPLTFDRHTVDILLQETSTVLTGSKTALGDAIGVAIKRLQQRPAQSKVLILLTDGAANTGVDPAEATARAVAEALKIYTIGVGSSSETMDEDMLIRIAAQTGGQFFRAHDHTELEHIYRQLDKLEPIVAGSVRLRLQQELFHWPLAAALLIIALAGLPAARRGLRSTRLLQEAGGD